MDEFTVEFYYTFKEEWTQKLVKLAHKIEKKRMLTNYFYDAIINHI